MRRTPLKAKKGFRQKTLAEVRAKQAEKRTKRPRKRAKLKKTNRTTKKKKPSLRLLKNKLWAECKRITRLRHGNICYTCNATGLEGGNWQTGHFIPSSICSTEMRYDLDNLRPQCMRCNIHLSGNWPAYEKHLIKDGIDIEELKQRNEETKNEMYRADWYLAKIEEYKQIT